MKTTTIIILLLAVTAQTAYPQETARERIEQRNQTEAARSTANTTLDVNLPENQLSEILENSRWSRIIYRHIDLTKPENSLLYYPASHSEDQANLFSKIFTLLKNGNIKAYEYLDGHELFTDNYLINFPEFLKRFEINSESDIPSDEVQAYYIKEIYYYDTPTSSLRIQPVAICPILHRHDNYEGTTRYPLFWVPYSQIAPYARQMPVMLSGLNNSIRGTMDDFFRMRRYNGEIILRNTSSPEEMKAEQKRIEQELSDFETRVRQQEANLPRERSQESFSPNKRRNNRSTINNEGTSQSMRNRRY